MRIPITTHSSLPSNTNMRIPTTTHLTPPSNTIPSNNQSKVMVKLKNVKCIFIVENKSIKFFNKFSKHKKNLILRYVKKVCLTIYPNNPLKIHATGISNSFDFESLLSFFESNDMKISEIVINNTFWIIKPLVIPHFKKFATFCKDKKKIKFSFFRHVKLWIEW